MKIENEFIPYEQALTLKELGFDKECLKWYIHSKNLSDDIIFLQYKKDEEFAFAPLYQQAFRFLYKELGRDGFGIMPIDIDKCNKELNKLIEIVKETNNE